MTRFPVTKSRDVRSAFWRAMFATKPRHLWGKSQNELPTALRCAFVDFVDMLAREGTISERLASSVTLDSV